MAVLTSPPYREDSVPQRLITLAEGLFEVVSLALFLRPAAFPAMLPAGAQSQSHFFDLWLTVAQIRCAAGYRAVLWGSLLWPHDIMVWLSAAGRGNALSKMHVSSGDPPSSDVSVVSAS